MTKPTAKMVFECEEHRNLYEVLQEIVDAGARPQVKTVSKRAGIKSHFLRNYSRNQTWRIEFLHLVEKEEAKWLKHGGSDYKKLKKALEDIVNAGERPLPSIIEKEAGKGLNYLNLNKPRGVFPWLRKLVKEIKKEDRKWQENGGKEYEILTESLKKIIKSGERPTLINVCTEAEYAVQNLYKSPFPWQAKIKAKIKEARPEWEQHGGNDYKKCRVAIDEIIKQGMIPNTTNVAIKAGFNKNQLMHEITIPWKQKIRKEIKDAAHDGMDELKILFMDIETLIHKVSEKGEDLGDYRRLGVSVKLPNLDEVNKYNVAHVMYACYRLISVGNTGIMKVVVDQASYRENRKVYIDSIVRACENMKYSILDKAIPKMTEAALWLGDKIPSSVEEAKQVFVDYLEYLHKLLKSGELKHLEAHKKQNGMIRLLAGIFLVDESEITEDVVAKLITQSGPKSNAFSSGTEFTQEDLAYAFAFYYHLFDQIADFLLENNKFPHVIQLPRGNATILGMGSTLIAPTYEPPKQGSIVVDYNDGHILTDQELEEIVKNEPTVKSKRDKRRNLHRSREKVFEKLADVNSESNYPSRLQLGKKALDAWFMCMLYLTLANDSVLATYEWSDNDEYETEKDERKEFITIKPRAQNKTIRFTIPKVFMPSFRKAIKLRKFVLDGMDFPYLYFASGYGDKAKMTKAQTRGGMSGMIVSQMIKLDSKLPRVCSRPPRKDGAKDALETYGIKVALAVLQNEEDTLISNYNGYTAEELALQVSELMQNVHNNVISDKPINEKQQSATGGCECKGELKPETYSDESSVKADCLDQKTCIFCSHYVTFPEPEEIRKLLSLRYLIKNTAYDRAGDETFYEKEMKPWLNRIKVILKQMVEKEPKAEEIIDTVRKEVYEDGLLSPYWLDWVVDLDELGRFA